MLNIPQKEIEKATAQDINELQKLLNQANEYSVKLSDKPAWKDLQKAYKAIEEQLRLGNIFIIHDSKGDISSSITLCETSDKWNELGRDNKALYFTKLMKNPKKAQPNEAKSLLEHAANEAERRNKIFLRCDALNDPSGIISYYRKLGFIERGRIIYESSHREGLLLEVPISLLLTKN